MAELISTLGMQYRKTSQEDESKTSQHQYSDMKNYDHYAMTDEVDRMNKQLQSLKESLIKNSVRCHMLEVDLATQFSPDMQEILRNTKEECSNCTEKLKTFDNEAVAKQDEGK